jgi:hypothetical protein
MTNIGIFDGETQTNEVRPMTLDELEEKKQQSIDYVVYEKVLADRNAAIASIYEKLGITADEAQLLFN